MKSHLCRSSGFSSVKFLHEPDASDASGLLVSRSTSLLRFIPEKSDVKPRHVLRARGCFFYRRELLYNRELVAAAGWKPHEHI